MSDPIPMAGDIPVHCAHDAIVRVVELRPYPRNAKLHPPEQINALAAVIRAHGWRLPITVSTRSGYIVRGHARLGAAQVLATEWAPVDYQDYATEEAERADRLADNRIPELGQVDRSLLREELLDLDTGLIELDTTGYTFEEIEELMTAAPPAPSSSPQHVATGVLAQRFIVPPFTVLDARQGYWQERKRAWIALGIQSELGRGDDLMRSGKSSCYAGTSAWAGKRGGSRTPDGEPHTGVTFTVSKRGEGGMGQQLLAKTRKTRGAFQVPAGEYEYPVEQIQAAAGTSVFDPVLCELIYRWFCPPGGAVLDPFAGGSVRGVVAALLGHPYTGIDLSGPQLEANRVQWAEIGSAVATVIEEQPEVDDPAELTPIEEHGGHLVKRDDKFGIAGARGGKVRTCWALAQGAPGLVTAGSRSSPQVNIVARVAQQLGIPCQVHTPTGELGPEVAEAQAMGAEVVQHAPGYNSVIIARARTAAEAQGWTEIPFGMECAEAVEQTRIQVGNLPEQLERLVVPVGSGMSLAGILHGLRDRGLAVPVLGVRVGADPTKRLDEFGPPDWREMVELVEAPLDYHQAPAEQHLGDLQLDPIYEAKCLPYLQPGDLLWVVGIRPSLSSSSQPTLVREGGGDSKPDPVWLEGDALDLEQLVPEDEVADLVFTCPPYFDLEIYSDHPRDLSTMSWDAFMAAYRTIIARACQRLRPERFAAIVVGDVRDNAGRYRNLVGETVAAFEAAGLALYNEAVLVTAVGSLPIRIGKQFQAGRKLGKTHQNVLVFYKGNPAEIKGQFGMVQAGEVPDKAP